MTHLESVIEGCRSGDAAMQHELYRLYSPRFYSLCRRYTHDQPSADEALTEGFICIFRDIRSYRGEGSFEGWMRTIFLRQIVRIYKRDSKHYINSIDEYSSGDVGDRITVEKYDVSIDVRKALEESLKCLDDKQRMAFNLVAVEDYSIIDAAKMLEMNLSTFKSQYYQAREKMKDILIKRLGKQYIKNLIEN